MKEIELKNGDRLFIAKAQKEDAKGIIEYLNIVGGESDNLLFGKNEFKMAVEQEKNYLDSLESLPTSIMLCGKIGGKIASVCSISAPSRERIAHTSEMAVSVKKEYWGMGIATAMMSELIDFARQTSKIEIIHLGVRAQNKNAIHLYKKFGFEEIGIYKNFFKIDDRYYDEILMNLYL